MRLPRRLWEAPAAWVIRTLLQALASTYRTVGFVGEEQIEGLSRDGSPMLFYFWHDRLLLFGPTLARALQRRSVPLTALISRSSDGDLASRVAAGWGVDTVRGSSSRGGREAMGDLHRRLTREGRNIVLVPDGPRGPRRRLKKGMLVIARRAGAPVVPLAWVARSTWTLRTWDRLEVPKPFTRLVLAAGSPRPVPRGLTPEASEALRRELEEDLERLEAAAMARLTGGEAAP